MRRLSRDPSWILTLLAAGGALLICLVMVGSRLLIPAERAVIPTESWPWTIDGVAVDPVGDDSPFEEGDLIVAMDGRPIEAWAAAAAGLSPTSLATVVSFDVRRGETDVRIVAPRLTFPPERVGGASVGLAVFGGGALLLATFLLFRRPQSTPLRILFVATAANAADIVAWEIDLQPTDLALQSPFLPAFGFAALCGLLFWSCLLHLLTIYPVRSQWSKGRGWLVPTIYAGPFVAFGSAVLVARIASGASVLAWVDRLAGVVGLIASVMLVLIVAATLAGYRRTPEPRRRQVRAIAVSLVFAVTAELVLVALPITLTGAPLVPRNTAAILALPVPIAIAFAVIRSHLFQVNLLMGSRERIVAAREDERRRLRRELHDGLGPSLAAIGLQLDVARGEIATNPTAADTVLVEARAAIRAVVADIRRVARELRPPSLDALGLVGAIRQQADGLGAMAGAGPAIVIDAPDSLPTLPAATEVAAYRIATEALLNVVRHADAQRCAIRLAVDRDGLLIEIEDDGNGVGDAAGGVGTRSIYERAAEVGGDATIESRLGGGTRVLARLPFAAGDALR